MKMKYPDFLANHTPGSVIELPAELNFPVAIGKAFSNCTFRGNNTRWADCQKATFLDDTEDGIWKGILPPGHTFFYRDGKRVNRSRWPETEMLHCTDWEKKWNDDKSKLLVNRLHISIPAEIRDDLASATAVMYFDWLNIRLGVTGMAEDHIELSKERLQGAKECKFFFENVPVKYLTPGKWLPVPEEGVFYYKPLPGEQRIDAAFATTGTTQLLTVYNAENVVFENITFTCNGDSMRTNAGQADVAGPAAVVLRGAKNCVFRNCTFTDLARWGLLIADGSTGNRIEHCTFENMGSGAIRIEGNEGAPLPELATSGSTVDSTRITNGGQLWAGCSAITIKHASHTTISNCEICHFPYTGISCGWTWGMKPSPAYGNVIIGNHVHHLGLERCVRDMGGIYLLGKQPGTVVAENHIHDIEGEGLAWGLYLDEGSSDMVVRDNLIYNCDSEPFHVHYGKDNIVSGNVFIAKRSKPCVSVTRGTMDFKNYFVKGDKVFDFRDNLCIADGAPFYLKYLLDIEGKEDILDSWKGDNNLYIQLDPAFTAKFGDDFHCFEKTFREIPESVFIVPGREEHSVFLSGALPAPEKVPEAVQKSYRFYLEQTGH